MNKVAKENAATYYRNNFEKHTISLFDPYVTISNFHEITQMNNENLSTRSHEHNGMLKKINKR